MKNPGGSRKFRIAAPAKVNLFFELLGKRSDGFHEIETVMSTIGLFDFLDVKSRADQNIDLEVRFEAGSCESPDFIPLDERNLVYQAFDRVRKFAVECGKCDSIESMGVDVVLEKRIPSSAGLGGASSDAAAAIVAANRIWDLELSPTDMHEIAAKIGSDVPFFLYGGLAVCRGRGELIEPFNAPSSTALVVAKPRLGLSTADVYRQCRVPAESQTSADLMVSLTAGDAVGAGQRLFNRLETFANEILDQQSTPIIRGLRSEFEKLGCLGHQMSGSGSSYFGVFRNFNDAQRASKILSARLPETKVVCCRTLSADSASYTFEENSQNDLAECITGRIRE